MLTGPVVLSSIRSSLLYTTPFLRPRDAALPAESAAARPLSESRRRVGHSRAQQPPSVPGAVRPGAPLPGAGAAV